MSAITTAKRSFLIKVNGTTMSVVLVCLFLSATAPAPYRELIILAALVSLLAVGYWGNSKQSDELEEVKALLSAKEHYHEEYRTASIRQLDRLADAESIAIKTNDHLRRRNDRLQTYLNHVLDVSRMEELHTGNFEYSIQTIQRTLIKALNVESTYIWRLEGTDDLLCIASWMSIPHAFPESKRISRDDFPGTFEMLESGTIIDTSGDNPDLQRLKLKVGDLTQETSVIGCPYFLDGQFAGFFSCRAKNRQWQQEDIIFVRAIADVLQLAFKSFHRKNHHTLLEETKAEISKLNESLEQKVAERTTELKLRNEQLLKFAFMNSHDIRGPICRLMGLRNLLAVTTDAEEAIQLQRHISSSIDELDQITRSATKLLNDACSG